MCYRSRLLINKFNARGSGYELERRFSEVVEIAVGATAQLLFVTNPSLSPAPSSRMPAAATSDGSG